MTSFGGHARIGAAQHGASVKTGRFIAYSFNERCQMRGAFSSVHQSGVGAGFGQSSLKRRIHILTKLGFDGHLNEVMGVQAHEALFDHRRPFKPIVLHRQDDRGGSAVWCPVTGATFFLGIRIRGAGGGLGSAARLAASASISGITSEAAAIWPGRPSWINRSALARNDDRSASLIFGSIPDRGFMGGSSRNVHGCDVPGATSRLTSAGRRHPPDTASVR